MLGNKYVVKNYNVNLENWIEENPWIKNSKLYKSGEYLNYEDIPIVNFYDFNISNYDLFSDFADVVNFWKLDESDGKYFPYESYIILLFLPFKEINLIEKIYNTKFSYNIFKELKNKIKDKIKDENELTFFIKENDLKKIKFLVKCGVKITEKILKAAAENGNVEIMDFLVKNASDLEDRYVFYIILRYKYFTIAQDLIDNGFNIHEKDEDFLRNYAMLGDFEAIKFFVKNGADINAKNSETLLLSIKNLEIVEYLVKNGSNITCDILQQAVRNGEIDILEYLIENDRDMNIQNSAGCSDMLLKTASSENNFVMFKYLINNGVKINKIFNIIYSNIEYNNLEFIQYLINYSIKYNIEYDKNFLLKYTINTHKYDIALLFIENGAKFDENYIDKMFENKNYDFFRFVLNNNIIDPIYIEKLYNIEEFPEDIQDMIINS